MSAYWKDCPTGLFEGIFSAEKEKEKILIFVEVPPSRQFFAWIKGVILLWMYGSNIFFLLIFAKQEQAVSRHYG